MPRPGIPDPYRLKARQEGYVSRAVYKLKEMDRKYHLLKPGQRVLDLGCSPGSWMQYSASRVGPAGLVVGVDLNPPDLEVAPPLYFVPGAVESLDLQAVQALSPEFDVVLSDLAPKTTGVKDVDHRRSLDLARRAWDYARQILKPGGHFLVKVFEGPETPALVKDLKDAFASCRIVKPPGSRAASREMYLLALNKRAAHPPRGDDPHPGPRRS